MPRRRPSVLLLLCCLLALGGLAWQRSGSQPAPATALLPALQREGPTWWKGNLHTHSLWSDGDDFPEMIADWYKTKGYHFLALSDHNVLSEGQRWIDVKAKTPREEAVTKYQARFGPRWVEQRDHLVEPKKTAKKPDSDPEKEPEKIRQVRLKPLAEFRSVLEEPGRFLLIPAEEITSKFAKYPVHLNAINLRDVIQPISGDSALETVRANLRAVEAQRKKTGWRMLAFVNHPNFGWGLKAEDMLAEEVRFFEVFNGHPGVKNYGDTIHPSCEQMWDILLALRLGKHKLPILHGLATNDAHGYHVYGVGKTNPGRGWVMVRAPHLTAEALIAAMEAGDFYASTGVTLADIHRDQDQLSLRIQGEAGVAYKTQFIGTLKDVSLEAGVRKNEKGEELLDVTRLYSSEIGKVLAESEGLTPTYRFTGKELYVRTKIISTKAHPNPFLKGDVEVAWTQPVN